MTQTHGGSMRPAALHSFHFTDIDQYRSAVRKLNVDFTPLTFPRAHNISARQIILSLPGCDINTTRSFPRIVDAQLACGCTALGFSMDDHDAQIRFNGVERDRGVIVAGSHGARYHSVARVARECALIIFTSVIEDRWPVEPSQFRTFEIPLAAQARLRVLIHEMLGVASQAAVLGDFSAYAAAMKDSLLAGLDAVFADAVAPQWASRANSSRMLKAFRQIVAATHDDLQNPVYSEDLSKQIGISVRALHDAVQQYRGMSLHRYLRLRRLWMVRKQLLAGADSVKSAALAFGFWHLSDFSRSYRQQFGEMPSATLARGRAGRS